MAVSHFVWPIPRSAYIHVPFCRHRCGYCNFSVIADRDELIDHYLTAIDCELASLECPEVNTVFIGGGTPTHLPHQKLTRLLDILRHRFQFIDDDFEFSVEANPEDIDAAKLQTLVDGGVNRISLGVQSFSSEKLTLLERGHTGELAAAAIELAARMVGNVSVDLIFAAPGETLVDWQADLSTALSLPINHLSTYALTFEKGTSFWTRRMHGDLSNLDESTEVAMYQAARQMTAAAGLDHYEVSNFARAGNHCRHNIAYWNGRGWLAAGPGAARFVGGRRQVNHRSTTTYLKKIASGESPVAEDEPITVEQYARERAAFGVRLMEGVDLQPIAAETGLDLSELLSGAIERSCHENLVRVAGSRIKLTQRGILFADLVASRFLG